MISILTGAVVGMAVSVYGLFKLSKYKKLQEKLWLGNLIYAAIGIPLAVMGYLLGFRHFGYTAAVAFYLTPLLLQKLIGSDIEG
jgi:hypothetical protein